MSCIERSYAEVRLFDTVLIFLLFFGKDKNLFFTFQGKWGKSFGRVEKNCHACVCQNGSVTA